jgi:DNA-binding transcriptional MerR regulator
MDIGLGDRERRSRGRKRVVVTTENLRSQEVARLFGINAKTLFRLEEAGKIGPVPRSPSGQRRYTAENLRQVERHCRKVRKTLEETETEVLVLPPKTGEALYIGEVAQMFGVHQRTLHRLEQGGKLGPIPRDHTGKRRYRPTDIARLRKLLFGGSPPEPSWVKKKPRKTEPRKTT